MHYFKKGLFTVLGIWSGLLITSALNDVIYGRHESEKDTVENSQCDDETTE